MRIRWQEETQAEATRGNAAEKETVTAHANQSQKRGKRMQATPAIPPDHELPTPAATTPKMIPLENLIELHSKGLSSSQIAKIAGCNSSNVRNRLYASGVVSLGRYKKNRAEVFAATQSRILNNLTDDDIKKGSMLQKATAVGILYDKERLERGQSTENVQSFHADIAEIRAMRKTAPQDVPRATIEGESIVEVGEK